jgi:hypothetical protein
VLEDEPNGDQYSGTNDPEGFELDGLYVSQGVAGGVIDALNTDAREAYVYEERLMYEQGSRQKVREYIDQNDDCIPHPSPEAGEGDGCPSSSDSERSIGNNRGTPVGRKLTGGELEKLNSSTTNYGDDQCKLECKEIADQLDGVESCACDSGTPNPKCLTWKDWTDHGVTVKLRDWESGPNPKSYWEKRGIAPPSASADPIVKTIEIKLEKPIPGANSTIRVETPFGEGPGGVCESSGTYTVSVGDANTAPKSNGTPSDPELPPNGLLEAHVPSRMDDDCNPDLVKPGFHNQESGREMQIMKCSEIERLIKEIEGEKKAQIRQGEKTRLNCEDYRSFIGDKWETIHENTCWTFDE